MFPLRAGFGSRRDRRLSFSPAFCAGRARRPEAGQARQAGTPRSSRAFGDWNVFIGQAGKGRICYTLAQPKSREPSSLKRDPGYAFISDSPLEPARSEALFIMGFDISSGAEAEAEPKYPRTPGPRPSRI